MRELRHWPSDPRVARSRRSIGRCAQRRRLHAGGLQRCQWHEPVRICDGRDDEAVKAVENRPSEHLSESTCVSRIRSLQSAQVPCTVSLVDDGGRVAVSDQDEVEDQPPGPAVAVEKRVNLFETAMERGERLGKDRSARGEGVHAGLPNSPSLRG